LRDHGRRHGIAVRLSGRQSGKPPASRQAAGKQASQVGRRKAPFSFSPAGIETGLPKERPPPHDHRNRTIDVKPGSEKDFEAAVAKARPLFLRAKGGKGFELHKSVEKPSRYRLMAKWETLENHTVDFRGSEDFTAWRGLVGQYFAAPPEVEHTETVLTSAG
jgi:heme-degrading monooxygenase HmoA